MRVATAPSGKPYGLAFGALAAPPGAFTTLRLRYTPIDAATGVAAPPRTLQTWLKPDPANNYIVMLTQAAAADGVLNAGTYPLADGIYALQMRAGARIESDADALAAADAEDDAGWRVADLTATALPENERIALEAARATAAVELEGARLQADAFARAPVPAVPAAQRSLSAQLADAREREAAAAFAYEEAEAAIARAEARYARAEAEIVVVPRVETRVLTSGDVLALAVRHVDALGARRYRFSRVAPPSVANQRALLAGVAAWRNRLRARGRAEAMRAGERVLPGRRGALERLLYPDMPERARAAADEADFPRTPLAAPLSLAELRAALGGAAYDERAGAGASVEAQRRVDDAVALLNARWGTRIEVRDLAVVEPTINAPARLDLVVRHDGGVWGVDGAHTPNGRTLEGRARALVKKARAEAGAAEPAEPPLRNNDQGLYVVEQLVDGASNGGEATWRVRLVVAALVYPRRPLEVRVAEADFARQVALLEPNTYASLVADAGAEATVKANVGGAAASVTIWTRFWARVVPPRGAPRLVIKGSLDTSATALQRDEMLLALGLDAQPDGSAHRFAAAPSESGLYALVEAHLSRADAAQVAHSLQTLVFEPTSTGSLPLQRFAAAYALAPARVLALVALRVAPTLGVSVRRLDVRAYANARPIDVSARLPADAVDIKWTYMPFDTLAPRALASTSGVVAPIGSGVYTVSFSRPVIGTDGKCVRSAPTICDYVLDGEFWSERTQRYELESAATQAWGTARWHTPAPRSARVRRMPRAELLEAARTAEPTVADELALNDAGARDLDVGRRFASALRQYARRADDIALETFADAVRAHAARGDAATAQLGVALRRADASGTSGALLSGETLAALADTSVVTSDALARVADATTLATVARADLGRLVAQALDAAQRVPARTLFARLAYERADTAGGADAPALGATREVREWARAVTQRLDALPQQLRDAGYADVDTPAARFREEAVGEGFRAPRRDRDGRESTLPGAALFDADAYVRDLSLADLDARTARLSSAGIADVLAPLERVLAFDPARERDRRRVLTGVEPLDPLRTWGLVGEPWYAPGQPAHPEHDAASLVHGREGTGVAGGGTWTTLADRSVSASDDMATPFLRVMWACCRREQAAPGCWVGAPRLSRRPRDAEEVDDDGDDGAGEYDLAADLSQMLSTPARRGTAYAYDALLTLDDYDALYRGMVEARGASPCFGNPERVLALEALYNARIGGRLRVPYDPVDPEIARIADDFLFRGVYTSGIGGYQEVAPYSKLERQIVGWLRNDLQSRVWLSGGTPERSVTFWRIDPRADTAAPPAYSAALLRRFGLFARAVCKKRPNRNFALERGAQRVVASAAAVKAAVADTAAAEQKVAEATSALAASENAVAAAQSALEQQNDVVNDAGAAAATASKEAVAAAKTVSTFKGLVTKAGNIFRALKGEKAPPEEIAAAQKKLDEAEERRAAAERAAAEAREKEEAEKKRLEEENKKKRALEERLQREKEEREANAREQKAAADKAAVEKARLEEAERVALDEIEKTKKKARADLERQKRILDGKLAKYANMTAQSFDILSITFAHPMFELFRRNVDTVISSGANGKLFTQDEVVGYTKERDAALAEFTAARAALIPIFEEIARDEAAAAAASTLVDVDAALDNVKITRLAGLREIAARVAQRQITAGASMADAIERYIDRLNALRVKVDQRSQEVTAAANEEARRLKKRAEDTKRAEDERSAAAAADKAAAAASAASAAADASAQAKSAGNNALAQTSQDVGSDAQPLLAAIATAQQRLDASLASFNVAVLAQKALDSRKISKAGFGSPYWSKSDDLTAFVVARDALPKIAKNAKIGNKTIEEQGGVAEGFAASRDALKKAADAAADRLRDAKKAYDDYKAQIRNAVVTGAADLASVALAAADADPTQQPAAAAAVSAATAAAAADAAADKIDAAAKPVVAAAAVFTDADKAELRALQRIETTKRTPAVEIQIARLIARRELARSSTESVLPAVAAAATNVDEAAAVELPTLAPVAPASDPGVAAPAIVAEADRVDSDVDALVQSQQERDAVEEAVLALMRNAPLDFATVDAPVSESSFPAKTPYERVKATVQRLLGADVRVAQGQPRNTDLFSYVYGYGKNGEPGKTVTTLTLQKTADAKGVALPERVQQWELARTAARALLNAADNESVVDGDDDGSMAVDGGAAYEPVDAADAILTMIDAALTKLNTTSATRGNVTLADIANKSVPTTVTWSGKILQKDVQEAGRRIANDASLGVYRASGCIDAATLEAGPHAFAVSYCGTPNDAKLELLVSTNITSATKRRRERLESLVAWYNAS